MTDEELNEIFRAIRHRRTLSWATIEKMANEIKQARKPPAKPATYNWNHYADVIPTTSFPPKTTDADISPKAKEVLDRISASILRGYEDKIFEALWSGNSVMTCNVEPEKPTIGFAEMMLPPKFSRAEQLIRDRTVFNSLTPLPIADSQKKERS